MNSKADTIVLLWNCQECTQLKMNFDFSKAFMDTITGKNGTLLFVYYTFSNSGLKDLLKNLNIESDKAPLLKKFNGEIITDLPQIIEYMKINY
jgi:hypothetical protein